MKRIMALVAVGAVNALQRKGLRASNGMNRMLVALLAGILAALSVSAAVVPDPGDLSAYAQKRGETFYFQVTGSTIGAVWGTELYTLDSALAAAAVHAGILKDGETGVVKVTLLAGKQSYKGSRKNGVTSSDWGSYQGSYKVEKAGKSDGTAGVAAGTPVVPVNKSTSAEHPAKAMSTSPRSEECVKEGTIVLKDGSTDAKNRQVIQVGSQVVFKVSAYIDEFNGRKIINANAELGNLTEDTQNLVYSITFYDAAKNIVGAYATSITLDPKEDTQFGSALIEGKVEDFQKVTSYRLYACAYKTLPKK
jgi:hypothetical protein